MDNDRGRKPRFFGLRWRALFVLSAVLVALNVSMAYLVYRKSADRYESEQALRRLEHRRLLDGLMADGFDRLAASASLIVRLLSAPGAGEAGGVSAQRMKEVLQDHGGAIAAEWAPTGIHYVAAGELSTPSLSWPEDRLFSLPTGWLDSARHASIPQRRLVCASRCVLAVVVPVLREGKPPDLLVTERPVEGILEEFRMRTDAEVILLRRPDQDAGTKDRVFGRWGLEVAELTPDRPAMSVLERLAATVQLDRLRERPQRVFLGQDWYEVSEPSKVVGHGGVTYLFLHRVTSRVRAAEGLAAWSLLIGLAGTALSGIVLLTLVGRTAGRIRALERALPLVFVSTPARFREELVSLDGGTRARDEIDDLARAISGVSDRVAALQEGSREAQQALDACEQRLLLAGRTARVVPWHGRPLEGQFSLGEGADQINPMLTHVNSWTEFLALVHPEDRLDLIAEWRAGRAGGSFDAQFRLLLGEKEIDIHAVAEFDCAGPGATPRAIGMIRDISDLRALQRALKYHRGRPDQSVSRRIAQLVAERERAERLAESRARFLADMSHEIRTPLNAVLGLSQIGAEESRNRKVGHTFEQILAAGEHLMNVVNDVLDISKLEAGRLPIESRAFDLRKVLRQCTDMLRQLAETKGLSMRVGIAADVPDCIVGDDFRLRQIIVNLLGNAVKFTDSGSVSFEVERESDALLFIVRDTGIGIPPDQLERLFTRFHRQRVPSDENREGAGLGLSISNALAVLMGGRIQVSSKPGDGSEFVLRLPMQAARSRPDVQSIDTTSPAAQGRRLEGVRVLVADDVAINRRVLEALLQAEGARVAAVSNGRDAVLAVLDPRGPAFDVVLMDVEMPEMDGRRATREIRAGGCGVPVIGVTAHASAAERRRSLEAGMQDQLLKPIMRNTLVQAILGCRSGKGRALSAAPCAAGDQKTV